MNQRLLPAGWVETTLNQLLSFVIGGDWGKDPDHQDEDFDLAYCIRGAEIRDWDKNKGNTASLRKIKRSNLEKRRLQPNDILLEISGGGPDQPVGRTVFIDQDVFDNLASNDIVCTNFLRLLRPNKNLNSKYLNYYLKFFYATGQVINYQAGSNNLRNLKFKEFETISIPLPPLAEQHHIAKVLDDSLAMAARIRERLSSVQQQLKSFRQSVLADAVSGRLTADWRGGEKSEVALPAGWVETNFDKVLEKISNGMGGQQNKSGLGFPVSRIETISEQFINFDKIGYIETPDKQDTKDYLLNKGDILFSHINSPTHLGKTAVYDSEQPLYHGINLLRLRVNNSVIHYKFFNYYCNLFRLQGGFAAQAQHAVNQASLNQKKIKSFPIPLPPLPEQQEIVRRVDALFAHAEQVEQQMAVAMAQVEQLVQSLLAAAFDGSLSNAWRDANQALITGEHSAAALLAQITQQPPTKTRTKKSTKTTTNLA